MLDNQDTQRDDEDQSNFNKSHIAILKKSVVARVRDMNFHNPAPTVSRLESMWL